VADAVAAYGLETVCLDLLAPAARHLGELWNEDICSFSDVTIGLMRLQSALLAVTVPVAGIAGAASARRSVLLAPAPGDYHNFGLTMVAGFLERGGWSVTQLGDGAQATIEAALRRNWFGVLGLSAGSTAKLAAVQLMLPRLRAVSRNPDLGIMVGGPPCVADPGLARDIGADCTAADGQQAVKMAEALIAPRRTKPRVATG
jgi:methanogenic corrinoid protein MtbC1